jgi:hypothetical protein
MNMDFFYPPFGGTFLGVIGGIVVNYFHQRRTTNKEKAKYEKMIRSEIELCIGILEQERIQLLPVDRWISTVNSGGLKLFDVDTELPSLSLDYYRIQDYNSNAKEYIGKAWGEISAKTDQSTNAAKQFQHSRDWLLNALRDLEKTKFLNPVSSGWKFRK